MLKIMPAEKPLFSRPRNPWYLTVLLIIVGYLFVLFTQNWIGGLTPPEGVISDRLQILAAPLNAYFRDHKMVANAILILSSLWIDFCGLFLCARAIFGPTIRPYFELFLFGIYRQALQFLVSLPIPEGIIWEYPGFPSLLVDYASQNDFYFSAHTGISLLCAMEFVRTGKKGLEILGFSFFAFTVLTLICFRIHYTMDIFTAVFVSLYIIHTSEEHSSAIDRFLQSLGRKLKKSILRH